eukprot:GDKH01003254.1.p2 GENE.GDKH01003254.1~~GDKH01003254.1.p2  ORF type:complete len:77 (+),score=16.93 GDKH01003254.1:220-450(+)
MTGIEVGTLIFAILGVLGCIGFGVAFGKETPNTSQKDALWLTITMVALATFSMWGFWVCVYMHQMNPLIYPVHAEH